MTLHNKDRVRCSMLFAHLYGESPLAKWLSLILSVHLRGKVTPLAEHLQEAYTTMSASAMLKILLNFNESQYELQHCCPISLLTIW